MFTATAKALVEMFNQQNPVGTNVYLINDYGDAFWTATTGEAYVLGEDDPAYPTVEAVIELALADGDVYPLSRIIVAQNRIKENGSL